jgi:hypothetical protein
MRSPRRGASRTPTITGGQRIVRVKLGPLEQAKQLGSVGQAGTMLRYSRDSYYRFKELCDKGGELARHELSRRKPIRQSRAEPAIEAVEVALPAGRARRSINAGDAAWGKTVAEPVDGDVAAHIHASPACSAQAPGRLPFPKL